MSSKQAEIAATPAPSDPEKGGKPGQHWKQGEEHVLPKNNIPIVFTGLMCCTFLAALDQVRPLKCALYIRSLKRMRFRRRLLQPLFLLSSHG